MISPFVFVENPPIDKHTLAIKNTICARQNNGQILGAFPDFSFANTLSTLFRRICNKFSKRIALSYFNNGDLVKIKYRYILPTIVDLGNGFKHLGVEENDPVICFSERSVHSFICELSVYFSGLTFIPLSDKYQYVKEIVMKFNPSVFVCSRKTLAATLNALTSIKNCSVKHLIVTDVIERDLPQDEKYPFKFYFIKTVEKIGKTNKKENSVIKSSTTAIICVEKDSTECYSFSNASFIAAGAGLYGTGHGWQRERFASFNSIQDPTTSIMHMTVLVGGGTVFIPQDPANESDRIGWEVADYFEVIEPTILYMSLSMIEEFISISLEQLNEMSCFKRMLFKFFASLLHDIEKMEKVYEIQTVNCISEFSKSFLKTYGLNIGTRTKIVYTDATSIDEETRFMIKILTGAQIQKVLICNKFIGPVMVQYKDSEDFVPTASNVVRLRYEQRLGAHRRSLSPPIGEILVMSNTITSNADCKKDGWGYSIGYYGYIKEEGSIAIHTNDNEYEYEYEYEESSSHHDAEVLQL